MRYAARQPKRRSWSLIKTIVFLIAVACAGWLLFQQTVQSQLSRKVQAKIDQMLAGSDITATIRHANFLEGQGVELRNVSIGTKSAKQSFGSIPSAESLIEIYEAFVRSPICLPQLISGEIPIQSVEIRRARLNIVKDSTGVWNIQSAVRALQKIQTSGNSDVPLMLRDCQIELVDYSDPNQQRQIRISNLRLSVMPVDHAGRKLTQIRGQFSCSEVSKVHFTAWVDTANGFWKVNLNADDLRLNRDSLILMPRIFAAQLKPLRRLDGHLSVSGTISGDTGLVETPSVQLSGQCRGLAISDSRLPWPIDETGFEFQLSNSGFTIHFATGMLGKGRFRVNYGQEGWLTRSRWYANGQVLNYEHRADRRLEAILPAYCTKFCKDFKPKGTCDLQFDMAHDGRKLKRVIKSQLKDMTFTFVGLPYQINHCAGAANIVDGECQFQVRAIERDQPIDIVGSIHNMGKGSTFTCDVSVPGGLPINEKMSRALRKLPKLSDVLSAFNPLGFVGGTGRLERRVANGLVHKTFNVQLKNIDIRHDAFPYPIRNLTGSIQTQNDQYTFTRLLGSNGEGRVSCNGTWNPNDGLLAKLICHDVPLDDQLRVALKPSLREIWHGFRPRGTVDQMFVELHWPRGQRECDVTVEAHLAKEDKSSSIGAASIQPTWFPYEIQDLSGIIKIGDGNVTLSKIEGHHDRSWIKCDGDGKYSDASWSVRLTDMLVLSLAVDDDLIDAVPTALAPQVRNLQYQGKVNAQGEMTLAGRFVQLPDKTSLMTADKIDFNSSTFSLAWNVRLDMTGAKMTVGVPVENVFGAIKLIGQYDGQNAECRGELDVDSMMIYDNQITSVRGPIWLDNDRAAAGLFAQKNPAKTITESTPLQSIEQTSLIGRMHGGTVHLDAQINSGELGEFYVQSTLNDGKLEAACGEVCPSMKDVAGRTFAAVRLSGNCNGTHTYRGDGTLQLREAAIYELPPVLSLLKKLRIGRSDRTAFDSSNINFTISGETIDLNRIELLGDAISLLGNGQLDMDRKIDLNFYSIVGRNRFYIPVVSQLAHAGSQQALWIQVNGTIDDPQMTRTVLPQLNDSLRQLFQPSATTGPRQVAIRPLNASRQRRFQNETRATEQSTVLR